MQEYSYEERGGLRTMAWIFLIGGDLFLGMILWLVLFHGGNREGLLMLIPFALFWNAIVFYVLRNSPCRITLTEQACTVAWSRTRVKTYAWSDVSLTTIGINPVPSIQIHDRAWSFASYTIPRLVMLNGWSKTYSVLLNHIDMMKSSAQTREGSSEK